MLIGKLEEDVLSYLSLKRYEICDFFLLTHLQLHVSDKTSFADFSFVWFTAVVSCCVRLIRRHSASNIILISSMLNTIILIVVTINDWCFEIQGIIDDFRWCSLALSFRRFLRWWRIPIVKCYLFEFHIAYHRLSWKSLALVRFPHFLWNWEVLENEYITLNEIYQNWDTIIK